MSAGWSWRSTRDLALLLLGIQLAGAAAFVFAAARLTGSVPPAAGLVLAANVALFGGLAFYAHRRMRRAGPRTA